MRSLEIICPNEIRKKILKLPLQENFEKDPTILPPERRTVLVVETSLYNALDDFFVRY